MDRIGIEEGKGEGLNSDLGRDGGRIEYGLRKGEG